MQCFLADACRIDCSMPAISRALKACNWTNKRVHILARQRNEDLWNHHPFKISKRKRKDKQKFVPRLYLSHWFY